MALNLFILTCIFFTHNVYVMIVLMFLFGGVVSCRGTGVLYLLEFMPEEDRVWAGTLYSTVDAMFNLSIVLYFWVVSTNWIYFGIFIYFVIFIAAMVTWLFLPESPVYLL